MDSNLNDPLPLELPIPPAQANPESNPWFTIWLNPRKTMREILDSDPTRMVIVLSVLGGIAESLDKAEAKHMGDKLPLPAILAICLILGPIGGLLSVYFGGAIIKWTGSWIGGRGSTTDIRAALAWSNIPIIWALLLVIPKILLIGQDLFTSTPILDSAPTLKMLFIVFGLADLVIGIWSGFVTLKCLAEAQRFSAWKALLNIILPGVIILVPILIVVFAVYIK
jgi:hypothetical protein